MHWENQVRNHRFGNLRFGRLKIAEEFLAQTSRSVGMMVALSYTAAGAACQATQ